jgi:hypothetical protein
MGCMVDHIHLDKNTFNILFQKGTICSSLLLILLIVTVYIYMEIVSFKFTNNNGLVTFSFL